MGDEADGRHVRLARRRRNGGHHVAVLVHRRRRPARARAARRRARAAAPAAPACSDRSSNARRPACRAARSGGSDRGSSLTLQDSRIAEWPKGRRNEDFRATRPAWLHLGRRIEGGDHRRVVAGADVLLHRARDGARREAGAGEHVVEPPADVALPHVPPGRPPREQAVVVRIERAADVDEAAADDPLEQRALLRQLADRARLSLLRVHVALGARDIQVAAEDERPSGVAARRGVGLQRLEEPHLGGKVLAAVRHVDRGDGQIGRASTVDDAVLEVEGGMDEGRTLGSRCVLLTCKADAGVALAAVPVAPVALHLAEGGGHLVGSGLDFLQADDVRALARDPFLDLRVPRPDAVDVPGGDLHELSWRAGQA